MEQRSDEWFKARKGKLTGSNIGAALGTNPWKSPEDLIRQMVRDYHNAESEFTGNVATEYGTMHEPLALMDYLGKTGNLVNECGFIVHPEYDWLGASPDGLIDDDGIIEVKCPYGLRNKKGDELVFKSSDIQQHYYAQMQIEMACSGRTWCHFYQWSRNGDYLERIEYNKQWFDDHLPALKSFYQWYLSELDNPEHLDPKIKEINTQLAKLLVDEYDQLSQAIDDATARKKEVLAELVKISKKRDSVIFGRKLTKVERKGSVSYAKAIKDHIPELDLTPYTGKAVEYWRLS